MVTDFIVKFNPAVVAIEQPISADTAQRLHTALPAARASERGTAAVGLRSSVGRRLPLASKLFALLAEGEGGGELRALLSTEVDVRARGPLLPLLAGSLLALGRFLAGGLACLLR